MKSFEEKWNEIIKEVSNLKKENDSLKAELDLLTHRQQQIDNAADLLASVAFHIDEINFGCLRGLKSDIRKFAEKHVTTIGLNSYSLKL